MLSFRSLLSRLPDYILVMHLVVASSPSLFLRLSLLFRHPRLSLGGFKSLKVCGTLMRH